MVEITKAYEKTTNVRVVRMPMWWDEITVKRIMTKYGEVKKCEKEFWRDGYDGANLDNFAGLWNGNWRVKMTIQKAIPNSLWVAGKKFEIFYMGQDPTCFRFFDFNLYFAQNIHFIIFPGGARV